MFFDWKLVIDEAVYNPMIVCVSHNFRESEGVTVEHWSILMASRLEYMNMNDLLHRKNRLAVSLHNLSGISLCLFFLLLLSFFTLLESRIEFRCRKLRIKWDRQRCHGCNNGNNSEDCYKLESNEDFDQWVRHRRNFSPYHYEKALLVSGVLQKPAMYN